MITKYSKNYIHTYIPREKGRSTFIIHHLLPWEISTITPNLLSLWMLDFPKTVTPVCPITCAVLAMYPDMPPLNKWWHLFPWTWTDTHCLDQQESDTMWLLRLRHKNAMQFYLILLEHSCHALRKFKPRHMGRPHAGVLVDIPAEGPANNWHQSQKWEWCHQMTADPAVKSPSLSIFSAEA